MTAGSDALTAWQSLYANRDFAAVVGAFESRLRTGASETAPELRQIAAQSYLQLGRADAAVGEFIAAGSEYARRKSVNASICLANACTTLWRARAVEAAEFVALAAFCCPVECDAQVSTLRDLVGACAARSDWPQVGAALAAASRYPSTRALALSSALDLAMRDGPVFAGTEAFTAPQPSTFNSPQISIIVCSVDDARFDAFCAECDAAFLGDPFEIVRIGDAASMCEGYNRGMAIARGNILIFCHDDIEFLFSNGLNRLRAALEQADVVTAVGASEVVGPAWTNANVGHMQGWMAMQAHQGEYVVAVVGAPDTVRSLMSGDGCFIVCTSQVARQLRWDDATFTHFHMYDIDFCLRASQTGYRVAVAGALPISHHSGGAYDELWFLEAQKFNAKHGITLPIIHQANPWVSLMVKDRAVATRCMARLESVLTPRWFDVLAARITELFPLAVAQCREVSVLRELTAWSR